MKFKWRLDYYNTQKNKFYYEENCMHKNISEYMFYVYSEKISLT